jgi:hypothetical protein
MSSFHDRCCSMSGRFYLGLLALAVLGAGGCKRQVSVQATIGSPATLEASIVSKPAFDNMKTSVAYSSDDACAECHAEIAEQYAKHPMGRSLSPIDTTQMAESFESINRSSFDSGVFRYEAAVVDEKLVHSRTLLGDETHPVKEEHEVAFVVGSGQSGRSYLINHDGRLLMSPLTWYPQKEIWDLSPGYEHNDLGFHRPILEDCLFCHSNRAKLVADQKNKYEDPPFAGHAIGCQRCHGPGELHVRHHRDGKNVPGEYDRTIANPARLESALREAVCQQCHLAGVARLTTEGKSRYDFRPGMPLENTIATYVLEPSRAGDTNHFVGQVEQMYASHCFVASDGRLGCISCHDPHSTPQPEDKALFYRNRCIGCHAEEDCTTPLDSRLNHNGIDDCVSCHMPRVETDVRHAATTNHRIPRLPNDEPRTTLPQKSRHPIIAFPPRTQVVDDLEENRNLAIATLDASLYHPQNFTPTAFQSMIVPLQKAILRNPFDTRARETLGDILASNKRMDADDQYQAVLRQHPMREHSLVQQANLYTSARRIGDAIDGWQVACKQNPWMPGYALKLAGLLAQVDRWEDVYELATQMTRKFPTSPQMWQYLVESCLHLNKNDEAHDAFQVLIRFQPDAEEQLRAWLDSHPSQVAPASLP